MVAKDEERLAIGELAALMAEPGISAESVATQLRGYAQKNLIHSFGAFRGNGRTATRLYRPDQWMVAKVLSHLTEFGFADLSVLHTASLAMIVKDEEGFHGSRMQRAIQGLRDGESWVFELALFHGWDIGGRQVEGRLRKLTTKKPGGWHVPDGYLPRAMVTIDLGPIFRRLFANARPKKD